MAVAFAGKAVEMRVAEHIGDKHRIPTPMTTDRDVSAAKRRRLFESSANEDGDGSRSAFPAAMATRLCTYIDSLADRSEPTVRLMGPDEVKAKFSQAGIGLSLQGDQKAHCEKDLMEATELLLRYSLRTGSPHFFNQLYGRADPVSIAADWLSVATNTNCYTYEVAPVYTIMELEVLAKMASLVGGDFVEQHDGLFVPGGSIANLYGLHLAHNVADPEFASRGAAGGPVCVAFVSDQSHYSFLKAAKLTGLGTSNLVAVKTDERGRMCPAALEDAVVKAKEEGKTPFFVGATAATTVLGAYDPFVQISEVCKKHNMWHHVDACWGGGVLVSKKHRHLMDGVHLADSVAWNPHKMCATTLQCSIFLTKHRGLLARTNGTNAAYLFQPDKLNASLDSGDKTIQCGRKTDMFKLWLQWKARGDEGMAAIVDHCFDLAYYVASMIRADQSGAWQLVYEPSCTNVCFWYIPKKLRPFNWETSSEKQRSEIHKVAPLIKNEMQRLGDALIGFQAVNGRPNFFRMVFAACDIVTKDDINGVMERVARIGEEQYNKAH